MADLIIIARVDAQPGHAEELVAAQAEFVVLVRQQPGCIVYELHEDEDTPGKVLFYERWLDRESWDRHMNSAYMAAFRGKTAHWVAHAELLRMRQVA